MYADCILVDPAGTPTFHTCSATGTPLGPSRASRKSPRTWTRPRTALAGSQWCQSAIRVLLEWRYCESLSRSGRTAQLPARSREVPGQRTFTWNTVGRSRPWTGRSTYIRTACSDDTCLCGLSESWKPSRSQWPQRKAAFQLASVARHSSRPKAEISAQGREVNRPFYAIEWHRISMSVNLLAPPHGPGRMD